MMVNVVVLPQPEGPNRLTKHPSGTEKLTLYVRPEDVMPLTE